jgi:hypothetical protein
MADAKGVADDAYGYFRGIKFDIHAVEFDRVREHLNRYLAHEVPPHCRQVAQTALSHIEELEKALSSARHWHDAASGELRKLSAETPG